MTAPAVLAETRLTLNAAAARLGVSLPTVKRWVNAKKGVGGVVLESAKRGGVRLTSVEACDRFLARLNPGATPERTPAQRRQAADAARAKLQAMGC